MTAADDASRLEHYREAICAAAVKHGVPAAVLAGIIARESHAGAALDSRGRGDDGHGHGLTQIDDRSFPAWCAAWREVWIGAEHSLGAGITAIEKGAEVLAEKLRYLRAHYDGGSAMRPDMLEAELLHAAVAAYNAGETRVARALRKGLPFDTLTTGGDYSADVLARAERLADQAGYEWPGRARMVTEGET